MQISFDPIKDEVNRAKHGLSLALASQLDWDEALIWIDDRADYGEERQCALGIIGERVYFVAFVEREDVRRIISLRRANNREKLFYAKVSDD